MRDEIEHVQPVTPERRWRYRRGEDMRATETLTSVEPGSEAPPPGPDLRDRVSGFAAFAAQLLGQPGQKRGLRGGPETLEKARAAYLEAEYSGPGERRIASGRISETEV